MSKEFGKVLVEKLKEHGVELGEEVAKVVVEGVFDAAEEVIKESVNKYDDMLLPVLGLAKPKVLELADKINPED